jgi:molecular chaperone DnaK (HSP70)
MERQTVDFGIDLGTTNSAIARCTARGAEIIRNHDDSETTPSVVARTSRGQVLVGQQALEKLDPCPARQFKRVMGTENTHDLGGGAVWSPEALSAEVLKELKAAVQLRYDEQPEYAVITVPAMFQQPQCEATRRAAELAGLHVATLLQEPIAAATAYLNENPEEGNYLVYDLGGGTFDVSIVRLRDSEMSVVAHGGDNFLGGADFDREVYEWALQQLERQFGPHSELRQPPGYDQLLRECEEARKRLSTRTESFIDLGDWEDLKDAQLTLDQECLALIIERHVTRTITLARERIDQASLRVGEIRGVLLVGGPTKTPYVRRRLKEELGLPLCMDANPMTVVAVGAAIHASALLRPDRASRVSVPDQRAATIELHYDPVSPDTCTTVSGRVVEPAGFAGEIRLARANGDWETGWIPLRNSAFCAEVALNPNGGTEFRLALRDTKGTVWAVSPSAIAMRYGVAAARPVAPYNYGVVLNDGTVGLIIEREQPLPAGQTVPFRAAQTVRAGSNEDLAVYFVEGNSDVARHNILVGELRIRGQELRRTLREGEPIDVRIHIDESRLIKARVSIPAHDLDNDVDFQSLTVTPPIEELEASLANARQSLSEVEPGVAREDEEAVLRARRELEQIEAEFERVTRGEPGEAERTVSKLAGVNAQVDELDKKYGPQAKYHSAVGSIDRAESIARDMEDSLGVATASDLRKEAERCRRLNDERGLSAVEERADKLFWQHYWKTDESWIGWLQYVREQRRFASEPLPYDDYLKRADDCLRRRDYEGVRVNLVQAMEYLPKVETRENRFWDAGLRRS